MGQKEKLGMSTAWGVGWGGRIIKKGDAGDAREVLTVANRLYH